MSWQLGCVLVQLEEAQQPRSGIHKVRDEHLERACQHTSCSLNDLAGGGSENDSSGSREAGTFIRTEGVRFGLTSSGGVCPLEP